MSNSDLKKVNIQVNDYLLLSNDSDNNLIFSFKHNFNGMEINKDNLLKVCIDYIFNNSKMREPFTYCNKKYLYDVIDISYSLYNEGTLVDVSLRTKHLYHIYKFKLTNFINYPVYCIGTSFETFNDMIKKLNITDGHFTFEDKQIINNELLKNCNFSGYTLNEITFKKIMNKNRNNNNNNNNDFVMV